MLGTEKSRAIVEQALSYAGADQTEALLLVNDSALTRFAQNDIHQNVAESDAVLRVRVVVDNRIGVASGNDLSAEGIAALFKRALAAAKVQPPDPRFPGLPKPAPYPAVPSIPEDEQPIAPTVRAGLVGRTCSLAAEHDLVAAGALTTSIHEIAVANSNGVFAHHAGTEAEFVTVVMSADSSGYGFDRANTLTELDVDTVARRAVDKAVRSRGPRALPAGRYAVVLEPEATSDLLGSMAYTSFGGLQVEEGSSFLSGRLGESVLAPQVTIIDDALSSACLPMPFDYEGSPKQRVTVIDRGVAREVVHDSYTAALAGTQSTGHAFPAPNPYGPRPTHLSLQTGQSSLDQLIASIDEGLLVTRFHYTRVVHRPTVTVTGMTRDGTFLIRGGEVAFPVRNLRFTQSYVRALQEGCVVGNAARFCGEYGPYLCPAVLIPEFHFTGVTEF